MVYNVNKRRVDGGINKRQQKEIFNRSSPTENKVDPDAAKKARAARDAFVNELNQKHGGVTNAPAKHKAKLNNLNKKLYDLEGACVNLPKIHKVLNAEAAALSILKSMTATECSVYRLANRRSMFIK